MTDPFRARQRTPFSYITNASFRDLETGELLFPEFVCAQCGQGCIFNFQGIPVHHDEYLEMKEGQITISKRDHEAVVQVIEVKGHEKRD